MRHADEGSAGEQSESTGGYSATALTQETHGADGPPDVVVAGALVHRLGLRLLVGHVGRIAIGGHGTHGPEWPGGRVNAMEVVTFLYFFAMLVLFFRQKGW
ncbi:MAG TPA: hypothetical protein VNH11_27815 [Pirellulales bacterium]|nr:hypothetical protein [Pirellulales bacterium]